LKKKTSAAYYVDNFCVLTDHGRRGGRDPLQDDHCPRNHGVGLDRGRVLRRWHDWRRLRRSRRRSFGQVSYANTQGSLIEANFCCKVLDAVVLYGKSAIWVRFGIFYALRISHTITFRTMIYYSARPNIRMCKVIFLRHSSNRVT
jgi:hypothetical protein